MLESNIVPGSVRATRNGILETNLTVDYSSGTVELERDVNEDDYLEVRYRRGGAANRTGDLLFNWGNRLSFSDFATLELSTGLRWNAVPGRYSPAPYTHTGTVLGLATLIAGGGSFSSRTSIAGGYYSPDTTGMLRLDGMERTGMSVGLGEAVVYPASTPADPLLGQLGVSETTRGDLYSRI